MLIRYLRIAVIALIMVLHKLAMAQSSINFESIPGGQLPFEGLVINTQFQTSEGVVFELEDGTSPVLSQVGSPVTAFVSSFGDDTPAPGQDVGSFFLTDDGALAGLFSPALLIKYDPPTAAASGIILDVDFGELFTIEARDALDNVIESIALSANDSNAGDGIATPWSFSRQAADVYSIRLKGEREIAGMFGLGFDNFNARIPNICNGSFATVFIGNGDIPTSGSDVIMGTLGDDVINGLGGDDTICGLAGNDTINAGGGNDWVDGGTGRDDILGGGGNDEIFGGRGDDIIRGGGGDDDIEGEEGDDTLIGQSGNDTLDGGDGVDDINGGPGSCLLYTSPSPRDRG